MDSEDVAELRTVFAQSYKALEASLKDGQDIHCTFYDGSREFVMLVGAIASLEGGHLRIAGRTVQDMPMVLILPAEYTTFKMETVSETIGRRVGFSAGLTPL